MSRDADDDGKGRTLGSDKESKPSDTIAYSSPGALSMIGASTTGEGFHQQETLLVGSNDTIPDGPSLEDRVSAPAGEPAVNPEPPAAKGPGLMALRSSLRAYSDGVYTTINRETVSPKDGGRAGAVKLPYTSEDVIRRIGPYDVLEELGRGAMGVVYRAYSLRLCRECAIKVMIASDQASQVELVRFQNEAMLAARLEHPNIVPVFDAGEEAGEFYFVMGFVRGVSLGEFAADPNVDMQGLARIAAKAARALHYAHERGVVHRDVKPDNVIVDADGEPHITDFGIAANVRTEQRMTNEGALMGTPAYMSPEQINGEVAKIGPASDQYSLGATLFHMVTGRQPFTAPSTIELLIRTLEDDAPKASAVAAKLSGRRVDLDLDTIIGRSLEKKVSERYASIEGLADDLEAFAEDRPIVARPISATERLRKLIRRNRAAFMISTIVFATLLVVGSAFAAVTVFNIERTSATILEQDRIAGLEKAATLERAITVNMLQGRADVVRELVNKLRQDPTSKGIDVVRVDRSYAYTDLSTRKQVERRLTEPFLKKLAVERPELMSKVHEAKRLAFDAIDRNAFPPGSVFPYDRGEWNQMLESGKPVTRREIIDGEPILTVLKPIPNATDCQVCHGEVEGTGYDTNRVRAVLVVRHSQKAVEDRIAENRTVTRWVGLGTVGAMLAMMLLFGRLFGLRFRRRRFAD